MAENDRDNQSLDELLRRVDRMAGGQDKRSQKNLMSDADGEDENSETDVFDTEDDMVGDPPAEQSGKMGRHVHVHQNPIRGHGPLVVTTGRLRQAASDNGKYRGAA